MYLYALIKFLFTKKLLSGVSFQLGALKGNVSLQRFRLEKTHEGSISPDSDKKRLTASDKIPDGKEPEKLTSLSAIIKTMNEKFGTGFDLSDAEVIQDIHVLMGNADDVNSGIADDIKN